MRFLGKNFKNVKFFYYLKNYVLLIIPNFFFRKTLEKRLSNFTKNEIDNLIERVNYYNKIDNEVKVDSDWSKLSDLKIKKKGKTYFLMLIQYQELFRQNLNALSYLQILIMFHINLHLLNLGQLTLVKILFF